MSWALGLNMTLEKDRGVCNYSTVIRDPYLGRVSPRTFSQRAVPTSILSNHAQRCSHGHNSRLDRSLTLKVVGHVQACPGSFRSSNGRVDLWAAKSWAPYITSHKVVHTPVGEVIGQTSHNGFPWRLVAQFCYGRACWCGDHPGDGIMFGMNKNMKYKEQQKRTVHSFGCGRNRNGVVH